LNSARFETRSSCASGSALSSATHTCWRWVEQTSDSDSVSVAQIYAQKLRQAGRLQSHRSDIGQGQGPGAGPGAGGAARRPRGSPVARLGQTQS
jgi:hypothetical protein